MFTCGNLRKPEHQHSTVAEARVCYGLAPAWSTSAPVPVIVADRATDSQQRYLKDLGYAGDVKQLTRKEASRLIDVYKSRSAAVNEPKPTVDPYAQLKAGVLALLPSIAEGYYATRADDTEPFVFLRIKTAKTGRRKGYKVVQTQHSEQLIPRFTVHDGKVYPFHQNYVTAMKAMLLAATDPDECALEYARQLGRCCRCNATLTDERSRWYGIGPECEKFRPGIIETVDLKHDGRSYEDMQAVR